MEIKTKRCAKCKKEKPICSFNKYSKAKDGLQGYCKECSSVKSREWNNSNPETAKKRAKQWRESHPDRIRKSRNRWREANLDKLKAYYRQWYIDNKEKVSLKHSEWYRNNLGRVKDKTRKWRACNRDRASLYVTKYRAKKEGAPVSDFTQDQWQRIKNAYDSRCAYCGEKKKLTQDHVIPLSRGGSHTLSNIIPACKRCNSRKNARTPEEAHMPILILIKENK